MEFITEINTSGKKVLKSVKDPQKSIAIPKDIDEVAPGAFMRSLVIEEIIFPDHITDLPESVFSGLKYLKKVILPRNLTHIAKMFQYTPAIETVRLPEAITAIPNKAFYNCTELKAIVIPMGVKTIGEAAFEHCISLSRVTMFNHVERIEYCAFYYSGLKSLCLPRSIKEMEAMAFSECYELKSVTLQDGFSALGGIAFASCTNLETINLPDSLNSIGGGCFNNCEKLTIHHPKNYWLHFDGKALLRKEEPTGLISVVSKASSDHYDLPEGIESINGLSFFESDFKEVYLSESIKAIKAQAFYNCPRLEIVRLNAGIEEIQKKAFSECNALRLIEVPESVKDSAPKVIESLTQMHLTIKYLKPVSQTET